jgi:NAD(P)H dehydrogenase (quinone)
MNPHGGQESTILALNNIFYHWGAIIVSLGYTDPVVYAAGGNPYGTSNTASEDTVPEAVLKSAYHQGTRVARVAEALVKTRAV